jgi:hypothetical protein
MQVGCIELMIVSELLGDTPLSFRTKNECLPVSLCQVFVSTFVSEPKVANEVANWGNQITFLQT